MTDPDQLAELFEAARPRLRRIAQRILGSTTESEDALQESWLRVSHADTSTVHNLDAWVTTVTARVCLDALKHRQTRREDFTADDPRTDHPTQARGEHPEDEAMLSDSLGVAMAILLDTLTPPERVAFVLHDMFDVPFDDIAEVVGKTTEATRQLASRARRRVRGASEKRDTITQRHDELVRAFLAASRLGNFGALLRLLDPAATLRADAAVIAMGGAQYWQTDTIETGIVGANSVAQMFSGRAMAAQAVFLDGKPGAVWMHDQVIQVAFRFTIENDHITGIELVGDRDVLAHSLIERE